MNKTWLEIVMPASLVLVFCTIMVFGLTMSGLLSEPATVTSEPVGGVGEPTVVSNSVSSNTLPAGITAIDVASGDAHFKSNCAQCHAVNDVVVGPALAGIRQRRPEAWIQAWVKNSAKLVASGDAYALSVFNKYQKQEMPSFQLTSKEISQILDYIEASEASASGVAIN